jgi:hypothetical protein
MKIARMVLAGCAALAVVSSASLAQQAMTGSGTITTIDRLQGKIGIRQSQEGTVGANTVGVSEQYKMQGAQLDALHAGDRVTFSATEAGGVKTITKIEKK